MSGGKPRRFWIYRLGPDTAAWGDVAHDPVLMSAHMVRVKNVGSLFGFTAEQRDEVLRILERTGCPDLDGLGRVSV